jgi:hypothetical protein
VLNPPLPNRFQFGPKIVRMTSRPEISSSSLACASIGIGAALNAQITPTTSQRSVCIVTSPGFRSDHDTRTAPRCN